MDVCKLITFGLSGHIEQYTKKSLDSRSSSQSTLFGYATPDKWDPNKNADYSDCAVIDKIKVLEKSPGLAYLSPLCGIHLKDEEILLLPEPPTALKVGPDNAFSTLLRLQELKEKDTPGPLDEVSRTAYVKFWESHGARIGKVVNNAIQWETQ